MQQRPNHCLDVPRLELGFLSTKPPHLQKPRSLQTPKSCRW